MPVLLNPAAGSGAAGRLGRRLAVDPRVRVIDPCDPASLAAAAREIAAAGHARVVVVGGDGTLHHAAQGLVGSRCALGIVPRGTGNDFARSLGLPRDPSRALERALHAPARAVDVGCVGGRYFLGVVAVGLVGAVLDRVARVPPRLRGRPIYGWAVAREILAFHPAAVRLEHVAGTERCRGWIVALANATTFGGGMRIAPRADLDDGELDVVLVARTSRIEALAVLPRVYAGRHLTHRAVRTFRVREAALASDVPLGIYADGEPVGRSTPGGTPIRCVPRGLLVAA